VGFSGFQFNDSNYDNVNTNTGGSSQQLQKNILSSQALPTWQKKSHKPESMVALNVRKRPPNSKGHEKDREFIQKRLQPGEPIPG
jgi:hypothetical protein